MAKQAPDYELVLMLDPEVPDARREEIAVEARRRIESAGELKQERTWGLRKMAYEIEQRNEADYRFFRFGKGNGLLDDLNHNLRITDGVLRFRIFKVDADAPVIDPPPPFTLAAEGDRDRPRRRDDRPPRGPDPEAEAATGEAASEPPAPEPAAEAAPEPTPEEPAPEPAAEEPAAEAVPEPAAPEPATDAPAAGDDAEPDSDPA